jgi:hypothetical protein
MRLVAIATLLALSCSCSAADDGSAIAVDGVTESPVACVSIAAEARELIPGLDTAITDAAGRWGKSVTIADGCEYTIGVDDMPANDDGTVPVAESRWDGIYLQRSAIGPRLANTTVSECDEAWEAGGDPWKLLSRVLVHELGHALMLPHTSAQTDAMFDFSGYCYDPGPSEVEIAEAAGRQFVWEM